MTPMIEAMARVRFKRDDWENIQRFYKHILDEYEAGALQFVREAEEAGYVLTPRHPHPGVR